MHNEMRVGNNEKYLSADYLFSVGNKRYTKHFESFSKIIKGAIGLSGVLAGK